MAVAGTGAKAMVLTTDPSLAVASALGLADGTPETESGRLNDPKAATLGRSARRARHSRRKLCGSMPAGNDPKNSGAFDLRNDRELTLRQCRN